MSITWPIHACALLVLPTLAAAESSPWTWSPVCGVSVNHVRASMHDPAQAFAATYGGAVLRTDDWGVSWRQLSDFDPDALCVALVPNDPNTVFYGSEGGGVFRSTDGGATWERNDRGLYKTYVLSMAVEEKAPGRLFAGIQGAGIYQLHDWDSDWQPITGSRFEYETIVELAIDAGEDMLHALRQDSGLIVGRAGEGWSPRTSPGEPLRTVLAHPTDPGTVLLGGVGVYASFDEGRTWKELSEGLGGSSVYSLDASRDGESLILAGIMGDVARFDVGSRLWERLPCADPGHAVNTVAISPLDPNLVWAGAEGDGVYLSTDGGTTWEARDHGLPSGAGVSAAVDPDDQQIAYLGTYHGGIYKTTDGGESWTMLATPANNWRIVRALTVDPGEPSTLLAGIMPDGLWRSLDGGESWERIYPIDRKPNNGDACSSVLVDRTDSRRILAGTYGKGVQLSEDGGESWAAAGVTGEAVWALSQDPFDPDRLLAGTYHGIYRSLDGGRNWGKVSRVFSTRTVLFDPTSIDVAYATTRNEGLIWSTDGGVKWYRDQNMDDDLIDLWGAAVVTTADEERVLVIGSFRSGVAHRPLDDDFFADWTRWNDGLGGPLVRGVAAADQTNGRIYVALNGGGAGSILPSELPLAP